MFEAKPLILNGLRLRVFVYALWTSPGKPCVLNTHTLSSVRMHKYPLEQSSFICQMYEIDSCMCPLRYRV